MDGLSQLITQGSGKALRLVKTLLTNPILINVNPLQGWPYAIPLECEVDEEEASAEVSESLVITAEQKVSITDNVAPGSTTWTLSGYIPGIKAMEPTNYYTPFVRLNTDIIRMWFKKGAVLIFKGSDCRIHERVVIKSLKISQQADCRNKTPFSMTLKEINVMDFLTEVMETVQEMKATPAIGSALGGAALFGSTVATVVTTVSEQNAM